MKKIFTLFSCIVCLFAACSSETDDNKIPNLSDNGSLPQQNLKHAIELIDNAVDCYFSGAGMAMSRYYNPFTQSASTELGSVWMYTSSIEAVNATLKAMKTGADKDAAEIYSAHFNRYKELLAKLYENLEYYAGTYTLTSYTQTKEWTVYGVDRGRDKGMAEVEGIHNVYDDQMWLVRELLESYQITGEQRYLEKAEYLTSYILDGWDCTLDEQGNENGGITWGPGYVTKHSCSNGPIVSPLVWLHELYKGKADEITYGAIAPDKSRLQRTEKKADYYLRLAKAVYNYQKSHLLTAEGIYADMMGGDEHGGAIQYEDVDGVRYRAHSKLNDCVGEAYSYNSGTMLSGAADLLRATGEATYQTDLTSLADKSFARFAQADTSKPGCYTFNINGFCNWFNGVLMRGYVDAHKAYTGTEPYIDAFQKNLDYAYSQHLQSHMLPVNLLVGWHKIDKSKNKVEAMFTFAFAAEYAVLANYEWTKH